MIALIDRAVKVPQNNHTYVSSCLGPIAPPKSPVASEKGEKPSNNTFEGVFVYLGPNFQDRMSLRLSKVEALLQTHVLQKVTATVYKTDQKFEYAKNGFEFQDFTGTSLGSALEILANGPTSWPDIPEENISNHAKAVEHAMTEWGKKQKIQFSQAVWIDTVYRNTAGGKFGAVHFVHCDFPANDSASTLRGHGDWKDRVVKKLGPMTTEEYEKLNISKIVNVWMPLNKKVEAEPLAMMDVESLKDPSADLRVYEDERVNGGGLYHSVGVVPKPEQRWYIRDNMKLGEGVIFDSCSTPHTAVSLPDQGDKTRRSLECILIFLR